ncbi:MAG: hypothetical protein NT171_10835, partial [Planctomycetota bacterium]|nr:hypothetical protein [Planctomycetota bacterium]
GGKVLVSTIITVGSRQHRIVIATTIPVRVIGSAVEINGIALTTNGSLAIGGTNAPFAGVLQFDREAVVVGEMEVDPAFSFAPPTLKVVAVAPVAPSEAPKAPKVTAPAPVPVHNRDGSRTAADRPIRGNSVVGYSR